MEYDALYRQLINSIKAKIQRGEYKIGDKLDSERVMAQQYGINRLTVRKALKALEEEGLVKARQGSGTYVVRPLQESKQIEQGAGSTVSLSMLIRQSGYRSSRKVISFQKIPAAGQLAEKFPGEGQLFKMERLSYVNEEPYAVQKTYMSAEIFWDAQRYDFAEGSLYEYMDLHGRAPGKVESYLKIASPPAQYAGLLKMNPGRKGFVFEYLGYDRAQTLVEYTLSYYRPEYTSFRYQVQRNP
ncbi:GntR family transcriptional regulator [Lachnospiraceae bacterium JLR.KK008]